MNTTKSTVGVWELQGRKRTGKLLTVDRSSEIYVDHQEGKIRFTVDPRPRHGDSRHLRPAWIYLSRKQCRKLVDELKNILVAH